MTTPVPGTTLTADAPTTAAPVPATTTAPPVPVPGVQQFTLQGQGQITQDQLFAAIEAARAEEKAKLYSRIEKTDAQVNTLIAEREARLAAEKEAADKAAAEAKALEDEKLTLKQRFDKSEAENAERFKTLQAEIATRDALLAKEREYGQLMQYKADKVSELREPDPANQHFGIMPEFVDLINGTTQEEIDNSIATMVAKTRSIVEGVQQHEINSRAATPGVSPTAGNIGPLEQQGGQRTFTAEEIAAMPPGSKEHLALRAAHGMGRASSNRGMFG
jgi:hypothetical protein